MKNQSWASATTLALVIGCSAGPVEKSEPDVASVKLASHGDVGWHTHGTKIYPPTAAHGQKGALDPSEVPFRIEAVNWYGFETRKGVPHGLWASEYKVIVGKIHEMGFNTLRIPFSNEMWAKTDIVRNNDVSGCDDCKNKTPKEILALIIQHTHSLGMKVILDNHRSGAGNSAEDNGLWYTSSYPESVWLSDWRDIQAWVNGLELSDAVIGYELRNEPHTPGRGKTYLDGSTWGSGDGTGLANPDPFLAGCRTTSTCNDWRLAAERAGTLMLGDAEANGWPWPLIIVDGVGNFPNDGTVPADNDTEAGWWGGMLRGVNGNSTNTGAPIVLNLGWDSSTGLGEPIDGQVVYSAHDYGPDLYQQPWFNSSTCYESGCTGDSLVDIWYGKWGFVTDNIDPFPQGAYPWDNTGNHPTYTGYDAAPLFVGEFGTGPNSTDIESSVAGSQGHWFQSLIEFIRDSSDDSADATGLDAGNKRIRDLSWGYWAANGNDAYALLNNDFNAILYPEKVAALAPILSGGDTCGDNTCGPSESCSTCPGDCPCPTCGDNNCDANETCDTCALDCGACTCGNGSCDSAEDCNSCAADCSCAVCGNGTCEPSENCNTCADCEGVSAGKPSNRHCCGNGVVETPEANNAALCDDNP